MPNLFYSEEDRKIINIIRPVVGDYTLDALYVAKKVFDTLKENGYTIKKDEPERKLWPIIF